MIMAVMLVGKERLGNNSTSKADVPRRACYGGMVESYLAECANLRWMT